MGQRQQPDDAVSAVEPRSRLCRQRQRASLHAQPHHGQIAAINANLKGDYALATSINAATDPTMPANWIPLGTDGAGNVENSAQGFSGIFNGLGNTISISPSPPTPASQACLAIQRPDKQYRFDPRLGDSNYQSQGSSYAGGLVAVSSGSIANSYVTDSLSGQFSVGGLVGAESTAHPKLRFDGDS